MYSINKLYTIKPQVTEINTPISERIAAAVRDKCVDKKFPSLYSASCLTKAFHTQLQLSKNTHETALENTKKKTIMNGNSYSGR